MPSADGRGAMTWLGAINPSRSYPTALRYGGRFTTLAHFRFRVGPDGTVTGSLTQQDMDVVARWPRARYLLTIQNAAPMRATFTELVRSSAARARFVDECRRLLDTYPHAAGIDLDLELGPMRSTLGGQDPQPLVTDFVRELRERLHDIWLHWDLPAMQGPRTPTWVEWCDYRAFADYDSLVLMTYGFAWAGSGPGPSMPFDWLRDTLEYARGVLPMERVYVGCGLWARRWFLHRKPVRGGGQSDGDPPLRGRTAGSYLVARQWMLAQDRHVDSTVSDLPDWDRQPPLPFAAMLDHPNEAPFILPHVYDWATPALDAEGPEGTDPINPPLQPATYRGKTHLVAYSKDLNTDFAKPYQTTSHADVSGSAFEAQGYVELGGVREARDLSTFELGEDRAFRLSHAPVVEAQIFVSGEAVDLESPDVSWDALTGTLVFGTRTDHARETFWTQAADPNPDPMVRQVHYAIGSQRDFELLANPVRDSESVLLDGESFTDYSIDWEAAVLHISPEATVPPSATLEITYRDAQPAEPGSLRDYFLNVPSSRRVLPLQATPVAPTVNVIVNDVTLDPSEFTVSPDADPPTVTLASPPPNAATIFVVYAPEGERLQTFRLEHHAVKDDSVSVYLAGSPLPRDPGEGVLGWRLDPVEGEISLTERPPAAELAVEYDWWVGVPRRGSAVEARYTYSSAARFEVAYPVETKETDPDTGDERVVRSPLDGWADLALQVEFPWWGRDGVAAWVFEEGSDPPGPGERHLRRLGRVVQWYPMLRASHWVPLGRFRSTERDGRIDEWVQSEPRGFSVGDEVFFGGDAPRRRIQLTDAAIRTIDDVQRVVWEQDCFSRDLTYGTDWDVERAEEVFVRLLRPVPHAGDAVISVHFRAGGARLTRRVAASEALQRSTFNSEHPIRPDSEEVSTAQVGRLVRGEQYEADYQEGSFRVFRSVRQATDTFRAGGLQEAFEVHDVGGGEGSDPRRSFDLDSPALDPATVQAFLCVPGQDPTPVAFGLSRESDDGPYTLTLTQQPPPGSKLLVVYRTATWRFLLSHPNVRRDTVVVKVNGRELPSSPGSDRKVTERWTSREGEVSRPLRFEPVPSSDRAVFYPAGSEGWVELDRGADYVLVRGAPWEFRWLRPHASGTVVLTYEIPGGHPDWDMPSSRDGLLQIKGGIAPGSEVEVTYSYDEPFAPDDRVTITFRYFPRFVVVALGPELEDYARSLSATTRDQLPFRPGPASRAGVRLRALRATPSLSQKFWSGDVSLVLRPRRLRQMDGSPYWPPRMTITQEMLRFPPQGALVWYDDFRADTLGNSLAPATTFSYYKATGPYGWRRISSDGIPIAADNTVISGDTDPVSGKPLTLAVTGPQFLEQTSTTGLSRLLLNDDGFDPLEVEVNVKLVAGQLRAGLVWGATLPSQPPAGNPASWAFWLDGAAQEARLGRITPAGGVEVVRSAPFGVATGLRASYTPLRVRYRPGTGRLRCYVGGSFLFEEEVGDWPRGAVGLFCDRTHARFSAFRVGDADWWMPQEALRVDVRYVRQGQEVAEVYELGRAQRRFVAWDHEVWPDSVLRTGFFRITDPGVLEFDPANPDRSARQEDISSEYDYDHIRALEVDPDTDVSVRIEPEDRWVWVNDIYIGDARGFSVVHFTDNDLALAVGRLARSYGAGGVAYWSIGHENPSLWELLPAHHQPAS